MFDSPPTGSAEWLAGRVGRWTASRAPALMSFTVQRSYVVRGREFTSQTDAAKALGVSVPKLKAAIEGQDPDVAMVERRQPSASCLRLLTEIIIERLTQQPIERFQTPAMRRGLELEPDARLAYEMQNGLVTAPSAMVRHPTMEWVSATPDGFVGDDGINEFKCPDDVTKHWSMFATDGTTPYILSEYEWQGRHQLLCCPSRKWVDMSSYDPRFPAWMQIATIRVHRDAEKEADLISAIAWAEARVADAIAKTTPALAA